MPVPNRQPLSRAELEAEAGALLPSKEVISLLDLNIDIDLALALAAPIDLAVAANAQVALPVDAAVSANVLSFFSSAAAVANQGVMIGQFLSGEAVATADQTAVVDQTGNGDDAAVQSAGATGAAAPLGTTDAGAAADASSAGAASAAGDTGAAGAADTGSDATAQAIPVEDLPVEELTDAIDTLAGEVGAALENTLQDGLLNIDVKVVLDADLAAPIAGAVAANAQVAAPIDAAVAANVGSIGSEAIAIADQTAIITQTMEDVSAVATATQNAEVSQ